MRVLVTGGAGFIGSNLVRSLLAAGDDVAVVDDFTTGKPENLDPRASFRHLDIRSAEFATYVGEFKPEAVVHLAAQSSVPASWADPEHDRAVNAQGTRLVAEAALAAGARRLLSASSAAVYGEPAEVPLRESSTKRPVNPYGSSKLEAEHLLAEALHGSGVDYACLRFSNVYGPRQDASGEGGVVAVFCTRIAQGEMPVIYGDGSQTRDFIFVGDVVAAIHAALAAPEPLALDGADGPAYNISTGRESSVQHLLMAVRSASGYLGPVGAAPLPAGDVERSALDAEKASKRFGWKAGVDLETGMRFTWRWFGADR